MKKIFKSETTSSRALIFGMWDHPVDCYQVCSNYTSGVKIGPALGSHVLLWCLLGNKIKSSPKPQGLER